MRISDWSSDVCSSDLIRPAAIGERAHQPVDHLGGGVRVGGDRDQERGERARQAGEHSAGEDEADRALRAPGKRGEQRHRARSEEHTSELQSLMRISYAVFCLKKKN